MNGANDVFAFDVETGTIRWRYEGKPDTRAGSPMDRASRGVALGDGRVYLGIADGRLTALDQHTGQQVWQVQAERFQEGFAITGALVWTFYTVPGPASSATTPGPRTRMPGRAAVVLFDATYGGKQRKALVQVSKTGWAYILDRVTGEPLVGIDEKAVPQEARQKTAATQPYPRGDAIVPQQIDIAPEGATLLDNRELPNKAYMGGSLTQAQADDGGVFAALDVRTNRIAWRQQWREICYSGSVVTAGGIVFTGRADGRLTALDKRNGRKLWEFMTDAGVNTTVTTFEHKGKQYVVVHAGGGSFANGKRGDGIWMFSLDGKIGPVVASVEAAAATGGAGAAARPAVLPTLTSAADLVAGEAICREACLACHGASGAGGARRAVDRHCSAV